MNLKKLMIGLMAAAVCAIASPVSEHGKLSFKGFDVVDKNGNPYVLRGMSLFWDKWGFEKYHNSGVISTLANDWGANFVRTPNSGLDESRAKSLIDAAAQAGIYIMIDYHSHCAHKNASGAASFFGNIASYVKQKNYSHVLYELYNEPLYENCNDVTDTYSGGSLTSWNTIKGYAEQVIAAIRQHDDGIVIVGTPNYSQGTEAARANPITQYKNVGYTLHFYASTSGHASLRYNLLKGKCNDFPIFISEWGVSESSGDGAFNKEMNQTWMNWVESIGVSWANWAIADKSETSSALTGGANSNGGWNDGNLTASGKYVKNLMKGLNAGGSLSSVGLQSVNVDCSLLTGDGAYEFSRNGVGVFGNGVEAENYADSSNVQTKETGKSGRYIEAANKSSEATATYKLTDIPGPGYYVFYTRLGANSNGYVRYSINNGETVDSVEYSSTGSTTTFKGFQNKIALTAAGEATIQLSWTGDAALDVFSVVYADSTDSLDLGITSDMPLPEAIAPSVSAGSFSYEMTGRVFLLPEGAKELILFSMTGKKISSMKVEGRSSVALEGSMPSGLYMAMLKTDRGMLPLRINVTK